MPQKMTDIAIVKRFIRTCKDGWEQGWHERNGGNLTYRLTAEEVKECEPFFDGKNRPWTEMGVEDATLANEYFIATGSGKYFRNVEPDPEDSICIVQINEKGSCYRILWGLVNGGRPTSEFPTHYMNHCVRARATDGTCRVIYHAHTPSLIALTYVLPLNDKDITKVLWQSATECPVVFPDGVGVVPWMVPGGSAIAVATAKKMETYEAAVWAHHGLFCSGDDFDITFGLMHTIEKAADIYVRVMAAGGGKVLQTITDDDLRAIAVEFGVTLNESLLS